MQVVASFDPTSAMSGTFNMSLPGTRGKMIIYNESNINLILKFANNCTTYVPAWMAVAYCIHDLPNNIVQWSQQTKLNANAASISVVTVETLDANESLIGVYPAALVRNVNIGNTVSTAVGATLINDGSAANTQFIEATATGSPSSNVSIDNSGNSFIADTVGGVVRKLFQTIANTTNGVLLGIVNKWVEIVGGLQVDQTVIIQGKKIGFSADGDFVDGTVGNNVFIKAGGGNVYFQTPNGTNVAAISGANGGGTFYTVDGSGTLQPVLYTTGGNHTILQMANNAGTKLFINDANGVNLLSVDTSGNIRAKGTITASVTP